MGRAGLKLPVADRSQGARRTLLADAVGLSGCAVTSDAGGAERRSPSPLPAETKSGLPDKRLVLALEAIVDAIKETQLVGFGGRLSKSHSKGKWALQRRNLHKELLGRLGRSQQAQLGHLKQRTAFCLASAEAANGGAEPSLLLEITAPALSRTPSRERFSAGRGPSRAPPSRPTRDESPERQARSAIRGTSRERTSSKPRSLYASVRKGFTRPQEDRQQKESSEECTAAGLTVGSSEAERSRTARGDGSKRQPAGVVPLYGRPVSGHLSARS